jgi:ATP-dependent HslUV protease ATP-binding subunit HslU
LLEDISFHASRRGGQTLVVDEAYVNGVLGELAATEDLARYVL